MDLDALSRAVYPPTNEVWPGHRIEWAGSQWDVTIRADALLVSYTGVLLRHADLDGSPVLLGGIGGVKTHPNERAKGYAALGIGRAVEFFVSRDADFALLVCNDGLIDYYSRLGWHLFDGEMLTLQHGETEPFTFNRVMLLDVARAAPTSGTIDLLGPPW